MKSAREDWSYEQRICVDALTEYATLFRYPNEEVNFPDPAELLEAKKFCEVVNEMVMARIQ